MIRYTGGDILRDSSEALVNTVNCVGVMGRGIALQFKKAFPENFKSYETACRDGSVIPGKMFVFVTGSLVGPKYIVNFPTKRHWKGKSKIEDIQSGLIDLKDILKELRIRSVAIPPLGSGLGGLNWSEVKLAIESALQDMEDCTVVVYEPAGSPVPAEQVRNREVPKMTAGRAALIELVDRYLSGLLDPTVSLLEIHKLMYFMQEAGEPLRLNFTQAHYGPYAENLRHVLNAIEGHLVTGYADGGDTPTKEIGLVPGAVEDASAFLDGCPDTSNRFKRVANLVEGFESPFGLELLSTVHWILKTDPVKDIENIVEKTHAWNARKQRFTSRQIQLATTTLEQQGWVSDIDENLGLRQKG